MTLWDRKPSSGGGMGAIMRKILITSVGTATSVGLVKALRMAEPDIYLIGTDINRYGYTAGSMLVDEYYQIVYADHPDYMDKICEIVTKTGTDFLIPVNDMEIERIALAGDALSPNQVMVPDYPTVMRVRDKYLCMLEMQKNKIPTPPQCGCDDIQIKRIIRDRVGVGSKGITFVEEGQACSFDPKKQFMQECIEGQEYTVDILSDREGRPLYIIPRKRLEVKAGVSTKMEIERNEILIELAKRILAIYKIPGFSNIQFIEDRLGNYSFIEINPRFGGGSVASLLVSEGMTETFIDLMSSGKAIRESLEKNLKKVKWNSIITRYYEEVIKYSEESG